MHPSVDRPIDLCVLRRFACAGFEKPPQRQRSPHPSRSRQRAMRPRTQHLVPHPARRQAPPLSRRSKTTTRRLGFPRRYSSKWTKALMPRPPAPWSTRITSAASGLKGTEPPHSTSLLFMVLAYPAASKGCVQLTAFSCAAGRTKQDKRASGAREPRPISGLISSTILAVSY